MTKICFESMQNPLKSQRDTVTVTFFTESILIDELEFAISKIDPRKTRWS